ncbi:MULTISPECIES: S8 family peptidase [unclassified Knoellia]|uniref:S8 family peptidase n=1 Tax=Knoellia altitudinis TaxID=3404795 RepID=UPI00360E70A2
MPGPVLHHFRRGAVATVLGAVISTTMFAVAPTASADALDDGQWWRAAMGVEELHRTGTGKGVTVALIDGPIDSSVPELEGRIASSTTECLAPGGELRPSTMKGVISEHATSMAALIVGSGKGTASGGRGIAGIAPEATLRHYAAAYRSAGAESKLTCGLEYADLDVASEAIARSIRQAVKDGAKVISISLTAGYDDEFIPALLEAYEAGAIVVASTNNETRQVFWPGIGNGVVTVTHVDAAGNLDSSAMRKSSFVDFAAPGTKIATGGSTSSGWKSDVLSDGSSQATAITAGGLAALWSAHPGATGNQVLQAAKDAIGLRAEDGKFLTWFRRVGDNLPDASGKTESYGFGIASPADAVKLDVESLPDKNPMVEQKGVGMPTAQQIAAATGVTPTPTSSAGSSTPSPSQPSASATYQASGVAEPTQETGSSTSRWLGAGALVIALLVGLALFLRRRAKPVHLTAPAPDAGSPPRPSETSPPHDRHDIQAAADGAAATTKEHSHGQS